MEKNEDDIVGSISDTTKNRYLSFVIGEENFGIEIDSVKELINVFDITHVPKTQDYIKGIMNLRGDVIPIIDIRTRFLMEPKEYDELTCIVVLEQRDGNVGLIIDSVNEVKYIPEKNITPPPSVKLNYVNQYIKNLGRVDDGVILLIEVQKLLYDEAQAV